MSGTYTAGMGKRVVSLMAFRIYASHQSGRALRTEFSAPEITYDRDGKPSHFWGLRGSASAQNKTLVLTVVNPHLEQARECEIAVRGAGLSSGIATVLSAPDVHAHSTFDQADAVRTKEGSVSVESESFHVSARFGYSADFFIALINSSAVRIK